MIDDLKLLEKIFINELNKKGINTEGMTFEELEKAYEEIRKED